MTILGSLKYHIYETVLEGNDEETEYKVTFSVRIGSFSGPVETKTTVSLFDNLSEAKTSFEVNAANIFYRTSYTDVSIYHQRN